MTVPDQLYWAMNAFRWSSVGQVGDCRFLSILGAVRRRDFLALCGGQVKYAVTAPNATIAQSFLLHVMLPEAGLVPAFAFG